MLITGPVICDSRTCTRDGCSPQAGCQGHAWREMAPEYYRDTLNRLVAEAARDGVVLTVVQQAVMPPRMRHYETVVSVRRMRGVGE